MTIYDIEERIAQDLLQEAYIEALRLQKIFNFHDEKSELSLLNSKRKLKVSQDLLIVIKKALLFSKLTGGKYDVSLGKIIQKRKKGEEEPRLDCSFKDISIKGDEITITHSDVMIDLGSIAKGYIVDKIAEYLISEGVINGMVNGRGDIMLFGEDTKKVGIQHPRDKNRIIKTINLKNKAVATSGDYNQYKDSFDKSHILNQKEIISATVVAPSLMLADVYATALFVSDKKKRKELMDKNKKVQALTIDKDLKLNFYNNFESLLVKEEK